MIYDTGTATVTANNRTVTGTGTAWLLAGVNGGVFFRNGLSVPIAAVSADGNLTLAQNPPSGMAGSGAYAARECRGGERDDDPPAS